MLRAVTSEEEVEEIEQPPPVGDDWPETVSGNLEPAGSIPYFKPESDWPLSPKHNFLALDETDTADVTVEGSAIASGGLVRLWAERLPEHFEREQERLEIPQPAQPAET